MKLLDELTGFDWDKGNELKNESKHGVTTAEAEQIFLNEPLVVTDDLKHSHIEPRFHALGQTEEGRLLHITFTIRGGKIRVISARPMSRNERATYEQTT